MPIAILIGFLAISTVSFSKDVKFDVKKLNSCSIDINGDGSEDIILLTASKPSKLLALLFINNEYHTDTLNKDADELQLSCYKGNSVKESASGKKKGSTYETAGTYVQLKQPESSSIVYFWNNGKLKEIYTSD